METDSIFYQLFQQLPRTLFDLLELPAARATSYRFTSVELKKALRIDGLFVPKKPTLPIYVVEFQFQRVATFYANLFAKVFSYLEENDPRQDWNAVAIFPSRKAEPKDQAPYEDLLRSRRMKRVYLEEVAWGKNPPIGLSVLQLLGGTRKETQDLVPRLVRKAEKELADSDLQAKVVELVERLLLGRFPEFDREEIRMKFKLHDIRESKVWKEAHDLGREEGVEEGIEKGIEKGQEETNRRTIQRLLARGMSPTQIADLLGLPGDEVRRLMETAP